MNHAHSRTTPRVSPRGLTRVAERISFIYLERCVVLREDNAITAEDADGITHIPSATIGTLLLLVTGVITVLRLEQGFQTPTVRNTLKIFAPYAGISRSSS